MLVELGLVEQRYQAVLDAVGLSQTAVAARMGTSQSAVARLESAEVDVKLSTIERYAAAVGQRVEFHLVDDRPRRRRKAG